MTVGNATTVYLNDSQQIVAVVFYGAVYFMAHFSVLAEKIAHSHCQ